MDGQFQALIDAVDLARDEHALRQALKNFVAACGFDRFAYVQMSSTDGSGFSDYAPEWQERYYKQKFARIDPVVTTAKRLMSMFTWSADDLPARSSRLRKGAFFRRLSTSASAPASPCR